MNIWDNTEMLDRLEKNRSTLRAGGKRLTFDCMKNMVRDERVFCREGQRLGVARDGGVGLCAVLRGVTCGCCRGCEEFEGGGADTIGASN